MSTDRPSDSPAVGDLFLRAASGVFLDLLTVNDLLRTIMEKVVEVTGATKCFLILVDDDGTLDFRIARNMKREDIERPRNRISRNLIKKVVETGEHVMTGNANQDPRFEDMESVHSLVLKSIIVAPLKAERRVAGVVYIENHLAEGVFDETHLSMILKVAEQASLALGMTKQMQELKGERDRLQAENQSLREIFRAEYEFGRFLGSSAAMAKVAGQMTKIANSRHTVLIHGESGTGKELVARILHATGEWREQPFVAVNCAAVPGTLFESEMFGHVKGAFTGAERLRVGKVEAAEGGTLFLDEVGDLPLDMQAKLLRLLQERTYERVGENQTRKANIRVVSATNKDLATEVKQGNFREDLYYRLNQLPLTMPPLRDRPEDVQELAEHFLRQESRRVAGFEPEALAALRKYQWPGNVRELKNVVVRAAIYTTDGDLVRVDTVEPMLSGEVLTTSGEASTSEATLGPLLGLPYKEAMASFEERFLREMIRQNPSLSRTELAEKLAIPRRTFFQRLKSLNITGKKVSD